MLLAYGSRKAELTSKQELSITSFLSGDTLKTKSQII